MQRSGIPGAQREVRRWSWWWGICGCRGGGAVQEFVELSVWRGKFQLRKARDAGAVLSTLQLRTSEDLVSLEAT